jgi:hypothetical protein
MPPSLPAAAARKDVLLFALAAVGLTFVFWRPLWAGGGLVGGDVYSYYLPQKAFFAERLRAGEFPLWNNRSGHGYPLVGESQTGAFYPLHLVFYRTLGLNAAYNANHLLHYVLAFFFAALYARKIGLERPGALLAAAVYTYGWFPPRTCWEWAIIGGAYLPLALWCAEAWLESRRRRYVLLLSMTLALQMLAGHFNLAFILQLVLVAYVPLRLWLSRRSPTSFPSSSLGTPAARSYASRSIPPANPAESVASNTPALIASGGKTLAVLVAAIAFAFALAAVQLLPSWELRQNSRRVAAEDRVDPRDAFDPGVGHIPPLYWSQIVLPWFWYAPDIDLDKALSGLKLLSISSATNKVEAHLYFGLVPLALIVWGVVASRFGSAGINWLRLAPWLVLGLAAFAYTSGWLLPVTRHLPGFGFFRGPGRYGIVTTLAAGLFAGSALDALMIRRHGPRRLLPVAFVFVLTVADLWLISRLVTYSPMVAEPPINSLGESEVRRILERSEAPVRLWAPGANLPNLLGVASTPPYLGIGPAAYFDRELQMPDPAESTADSGPTEAHSTSQFDWLWRAGVTHILRFEPLSAREWPVRLLWSGADPFLNPAWGRSFAEPFYLYELDGSRGRAAFATNAAAKASSAGTARVTECHANRVVIEANSPDGGRLVLTDLTYPGWQVTIDGQPAEALVFERMYRAVDLPPGEHAVRWSYRPRSVLMGAMVSCAAVAAAVLACLIRLVRRNRTPNAH